MANTRFQAKRTTTSGLLPNTTNSGNLSYIAAGEFAVNLTDQKVLSSNGTLTFEVGANLSSLAAGNTTITGVLTANSSGNNDINAVASTNISAANVNITGVTTISGNNTTGLVVTVGTAGFTVIPPTSGTIILGGTVGTGNINVGQSTRNQTIQIAAAATTSGNTKTINLGTGGAAGSTTNVNIGATLSNSFVTINANTTTFTGAASGITTLAAGNTSITGFANVSTSVNSAALSVGTSFVANTTQVTIAAGVPLSANGGTGTAGQVLTSNGTTGSPYWSTVTSGTTYTFSTGLTNTTGTITVNSAYIATISANNASFLGGTAAASYALLSGGTFTGAVSGITTLAAGNTSITGFANVSTSVNSALLTVGTSFIANTTGAYHTGTINAASYTTTGVTINTTAIVPASNSSGQNFGNSIARFVITANSVTASGDVTAFSDISLKDDIVTINYALDKVKSIRGVSYVRKDYNDGLIRLGVIAQEIEKILPEVVIENADGIKAVNYSAIIPVLIEAIKEQQNQIDELRKQVNDATSK